jgi:hypothetical protein
MQVRLKLFKQTPYITEHTGRRHYSSKFLMLFRDRVVVCSKHQTKYTDALWSQNVELLAVKAGGSYSYHRALTGKLVSCFIIYGGLQIL